MTTSQPQDQPQRLLARLDAIGESLARSGHALALLALGSAGREVERLDAYSDLDFFVVVEAGRKAGYLDDLGWLSAVQPVAYRFRNTPDGYKLLFDDGIFCEFAVFGLEELRRAVFAPGRAVWKRAEVDEGQLQPAGSPAAAPQPDAVPPAEWLVGEALTNLYVGLGRYRRGEKLSAMRFIQSYAVDRIVELADRLEAPAPGNADRFARERRFERRFPGLERRLPQFMQGYDRSPESALAILGFLEEHVAVDAALARAIRERCEANGTDGG